MRKKDMDWYRQGAKTFSVECAHEIVGKYRPRFVGKGGEQIVYEAPEHPDVVVKVSVGSIAYSLSLLNEGKSLDEIMADEEVQANIRQWKEYRTSVFSQVKDYFGKEHMLSQKLVTMRVPRVPEIVSAVARFRTGFDVYQDHLPDELLVAAVIQKKCKAFESGEYESLSQGYSMEPSDTYFNGDGSLVFGGEVDVGEGGRFDDLRLDQEKSVAVKDFVRRAISYSRDTGQILDIAGDGNIILHKSDEGYTYTLVDAVYPGSEEELLTEVKAFVQRQLKDGEEAQPDELDAMSNRAVNALNYVTFVNGLAADLGLEERIDWLSGPEMAPHRDGVKTILGELRDRWLRGQKDNEM